MGYFVGNLNRVKKIFCPPIAGGTTQEVIADETLPSAGIFEVTDIPQTYDHLQIFMTVRTEAAAIDYDNVAVVVNGDTVSANYRIVTMDGKYNGAFVYAANNYLISRIVQSNRNNPGEFSGIEINIPFYANNYAWKNLHIHNGCDSKSFNYYHCNNSMIWKNTSPITSLRMSATTYPGGNFLADSDLKVIGVRAF